MNSISESLLLLMKNAGVRDSHRATIGLSHKGGFPIPALGSLQIGSLGDRAQLVCSLVGKERVDVSRIIGAR